MGRGKGQGAEGQKWEEEKGWKGRQGELMGEVNLPMHKFRLWPWDKD